MTQDRITQTSEEPPFLKAWLEADLGKRFLGSVIDGRYIKVPDTLPEAPE